MAAAARAGARQRKRQRAKLPPNSGEAPVSPCPGGGPPAGSLAPPPVTRAQVQSLVPGGPSGAPVGRALDLNTAQFGNAQRLQNVLSRQMLDSRVPPHGGAAHHYHFVVLALDARLGLAAGARRSDLESRMRGHVLGRGELVATYQQGSPVGFRDHQARRRTSTRKAPVAALTRTLITQCGQPAGASRANSRLDAVGSVKAS